MLTYAGNSVRFAHDICFSFPLYRVIFCFQPGLNNVQGLAQIMCCMTLFSHGCFLALFIYRRSFPRAYRLPLGKRCCVARSMPTSPKVMA